MPSWEPGLSKAFSVSDGRAKGTLVQFPSPGAESAMSGLGLGPEPQGVKVLVPGNLTFPH